MLINCPHCNAQLDAGPEKAGQIGICPHCNGNFAVPLPVAQPAGVESSSFDPFENDAVGIGLRPRRPLGLFDAPPNTGKIHVVIERTSKRYKGMKLAGVLLVVGAIMLASATRSDEPRPIISMMLFTGIGVFLYGMIAAWWHHG